MNEERQQFKANNRMDVPMYGTCVTCRESRPIMQACMTCNDRKNCGSVTIRIKEQNHEL